MKGGVQLMIMECMAILILLGIMAGYFYACICKLCVLAKISAYLSHYAKLVGFLVMKLRHSAYGNGRSLYSRHCRIKDSNVGTV